MPNANLTIRFVEYENTEHSALRRQPFARPSRGQYRIEQHCAYHRSDKEQADGI
jgi:hypothetical protein